LNIKHYNHVLNCKLISIKEAIMIVIKRVLLLVGISEKCRPTLWFVEIIVKFYHRNQ